MTDIYYFVRYYLYEIVLMLFLPVVLFSIFAQILIKTRYRKFSQVETAGGITAADAARRMLMRAGISDVSVECVPGTLTDRYDPRTGVVYLSRETYDSSSVSAVGVAAHEVGHVFQHAEGYAPLNLRIAAVPVVNIGSTVAVPLMIVGSLLPFTPLLPLGIFLFAGTTIFQLITLPVEFNASRRALAALDDFGLMYAEEIGDVKKVLDAAALTYVAAFVVSLLQLLRIVLMFYGRGSRRRR